MKRYEDIILDRFRLVSRCTVDADIVQAKLSGKIRKSEMRLMEDMDAYEQRRVLDAFGKHEVWRVSVPATWWEHLKLALRLKWPRLFKRLCVRKTVAEFDSGWVVPELATKVAARYAVIPYVTGAQIFDENER